MANRKAYPLIDIINIPHIRLCHQPTPIAGMEYRQFRVLRVQRPYTVIMHTKRMYTPPCRQAPHLNRRIRTGSKEVRPILAHQNRANIICVAHKLGNSLPTPRIPNPHDALRTTAGKDPSSGTKTVDRTLGITSSISNVNLQCLALPRNVPEFDLAVETPANNPVCGIRCRETFNIVAVDAKGFRGLLLGRVGAPELYGEVGGAGYQRGVGLA